MTTDTKADVAVVTKEAVEEAMKADVAEADMAAVTKLNRGSA